MAGRFNLGVLAPPANAPIITNVTKTVSTPQSGLIAVAVGYITFTPTTSASGSFSLSSQMIEGGALRLNNFGFTMNAHPDTVTGTWSINSAVDPTAVTITPTGGIAQTFTLRWADVVSGVARTFYLVRKDTVNSNTNCVTTINARKQ
jgi:hypothetical protein